MVEDSSLAAGNRSMEESDRLLREAISLIPDGTNTNSKGPKNWIRGVAPSHIDRGDGSRVWDVDGNEYIDYPIGRGPVVLGHDYEPVSTAVKERVEKGTAFSTPNPLQVEVARLVTEMVPCAEMVRFAKNGNDVTTAAAKLARAHTDRDVIATSGYHGWPDVWTAATKSTAGVPSVVGEKTESFAYNDLESLERVFEEHPDDVAAVVINPTDYERPEDDFLARVKEVAHREGALLVFDEIITGFRFAEGGGQEFFDVTPDLGCFAKGIANGFPLSCLCGREDVMRTMEDDDFVFSLTYGGEAVGLAAAKATLEIIQDEPVIPHLFERGEALIDGYNRLAAERSLDDVTRCVGFPPRSRVKFDDAGGIESRLLESLFQQECLKRGVLYAGVQFTTYSHTEADVEYTLDVYDAAMSEVAEAIAEDDVQDRLEGPPMGDPLPQRLGLE